MKGITPVIAIILLLMITIAIVGFAFVWFTRMTTSVANQTQSSLNEQQSQMMQTIKIDSYDASSNNVYIRNTGSVDINTDFLAVYMNGALATCSWGDSTLSPGVVTSCTVSGGYSCSGSTSIKVTSPGTPQGDLETC